MKRFIILDENKEIVKARLGRIIAINEIQSNYGELGQIMQEDGSFIDDLVELAKTEYNNEKAKVDTDLIELEKSIRRGDATQEDFDNRVAEWQAYKAQWEADNE